MYTGSWSETDFEQNFNLTCKSGSWTALHKLVNGTMDYEAMDL